MKKKENPFSYKKASDSTGFLLWKTHNFWQREIKKSLKEFDLTHTQFVVLANTYWLIMHNEQVMQIDIAQHAQIDVMMTSNVIRTLEKKGILSRIENKKDARGKIVTLTEKGEAVLRKAIKEVESFDRKFFGALKDTTEFNAELQRLLNKNN